MGAEIAVAVTVAAIFMVPSAVAKEDDGGIPWPAGDLGRALDVLLVSAFGAMCVWVGYLLLAPAPM